MELTPIADRLTIIANCVQSLKEMQSLTRDEFLSSYLV